LISIDPTHGEAACNAVRDQFVAHQDCADDSTGPAC
jgi:hypothetical protein